MHCRNISKGCTYYILYIYAKKQEGVHIVSKTLLAQQKKLELRGLNPAFSSSNAKLMHVLARLPDFFRLYSTEPTTQFYFNQ
jgi:hypothetical protein